MQSVIIRHSIVIAGHQTSISLEDEFWTGLTEVGKAQKTTLSELVAGIKSQRGGRQSLISHPDFRSRPFSRNLASVPKPPAWPPLSN